MSEDEVLAFFNKKVRAEHGNKVTIDDMFIDANLDSFGTTVVFLDMDEAYKAYDSIWFRSITDWTQVSIKDIIERAVNANS